MKHRDPIAVFGLGLITLGLYSWYWAVKTKGEMNKLGEHIPTAWIWLIPIVGGIWWYWEYSKGVEHVTKEKFNGVLAFVVLWLLGMIGQAIVQDSFNKLETAPAGVQPEPTSDIPEKSNEPSEPAPQPTEEPEPLVTAADAPDPTIEPSAPQEETPEHVVTPAEAPETPPEPEQTPKPFETPAEPKQTEEPPVTPTPPSATV